MPIYEFRCDKCGNRFEKLCSLGENGKELKCPKCSAVGAHRVMSGFTKKSSGGTEVIGSGGGSGCGSCSSTNCSSCGH
ncbi:FmdB family zinc ribbon protein [Desulfotruncus alcoholivorax]|uniref:FmdB family zinc ribbon protein n=1 Tax=Desulfotruncus alcoholivorax TaxID=265477 RepID=UPI00040CA915|nr:zinc ribbon domain-containing protein [Desulfotruncus alcoholivorax]